MEIVERGFLGGCPLCALVLQSLEKPIHVANPTALPTSEVLASLKERKSVCFVNWEIDGRDNDPSSGRKARTRRLHLHWNNKHVKDSYLVFVAPKRLFEINSDSRGSWEREAFFLGRELEIAGNNQVLMKSWLDQCVEQHGPACSGDHNDEFFDMVEQSYFGVIDCLDMCLKSLPLRPGKMTKKRSASRDVEVIIGNREERYREERYSEEIIGNREERYGSSPSEIDPSEAPISSNKGGKSHLVVRIQVLIDRRSRWRPLRTLRRPELCLGIEEKLHDRHLEHPGPSTTSKLTDVPGQNTQSHS